MSETGKLYAPTLVHARVTVGPAQWRICGIVLLFVVIAAVVCAARKDVTRGFDELAHVSYVAELQRTGEWWPTLERMRQLDETSFRFTANANYLNHPAPYYWLLAHLGPKLEGRPDVLLLDRLLNIAIVAAGLGALMAIAVSARMSQVELYAYIVPLACIPVLPALAGSVNNDNAAFAGGALATLAAWQLIVTARRSWLLAALAGMLIASWAKLTGLMLVGGMLAGVLLWLHWRGRFQQEWIAPLAVAALLAAAPYVIFLLQYGSPAPDTPGQVGMVSAAAQDAGWDKAARLSPAAYAFYFILQFIVQWMPSLTPRNGLNYLALAIPVMAAMCAAAGLALSLRRIAHREEGPLDVVVAAGSFAAVMTFVIHDVFAYERHIAYGWLMDAYPRYYLPLAAIIPLGGLSLLAAIKQPRARTATAAFLIASPFIFRLIGAPLG